MLQSSEIGHQPSFPDLILCRQHSPILLWLSWQRKCGGYPTAFSVRPNDESSFQISPSVLTHRRHDEFYLRFAGLSGPKGYTQIERVVPSGFPNLPFQLVYRYREGGSSFGPSVYQLGLGIFSANTTPPYTSWTRFRPIVQTGLELLLAASDDAGRPKQFASVALRYIDGFDDRFSQGMPYGKFIESILGFRNKLPESIARHVSDDEKVRPHLDIFAPLKNGLQLNLKLADGQIRGRRAVIMETAVSTQRPVDASIDSTMNALDSAHEILHSSFMEMSKPLHEVMQPLEEHPG